ncbi:MAG: carbon-nitrogen hydrolase family protein [Tatlockia sp.]|nr:carbon-nitrogen hydrolase family protein [Tatlockia sp.]
MPTIAAIQMVSSSSVKANLAQVEKFIIEAKSKQVELVVLPENFAFMGLIETDKLQIAEFFSEGEIQSKLSELAKKYGLWIIAGTMPLRGASNKVRASCLVFDNHGLFVTRYDKIHLFDVQVSEQEKYLESATVERGEELIVVDTPVGKVGLSVCYDLRFPELYRQLVHKGAELLTVPSAFTALTGRVHWEVLLRARAIENLCYVVAANQGGLHENGRQTYGHSMIIEPWGKIIACAEQQIGLITAKIDLRKLQQLRAEFPTNEHHVLFNAVPARRDL